MSLNSLFSKVRQSKSFVPLALLAFLVAFFWPVFFKGYVLSPAGLLVRISPWSHIQDALISAGNYKPVSTIFWDEMAEMYPWQSFFADCVRQGTWPLWNPYNGLGYPLFANSQSAFFFPLSWIALFMPIGVAFTVGDIIKLFFSGWGTYLFLREIGLGRRASLFGGTTFMFCGWNMVWLNVPLTNPSSLLPFLFLFIERHIKEGDLRSLACLSVVVSLQILGGHMETAAHAGLAAGLYAAMRLAGEGWAGKDPLRAGRKAGLLLASYVFGVLLSSVEFLPFLKSIHESHEFLTRSVRYSNNPASSFALLMPDLLGHPAITNVTYDNLLPGFGNYNERMQYVGLLPLVLALFAVLYSWKERRTTILTIILLFCWSIIFRVQPVFDLFTMIPPFDRAANTRLLMVAQFMLALLSAIGLDRIVRGGVEKGRIKTVVFVLSTGALLGALILSLIPLLHISIQEPFEGYFHSRVIRFTVIGLLSAVVFAGLVTSKRKTLFFAAAILLLLADHYQLHGRYNPLIPAATARPPASKSLERLQRLTRSTADRFAGGGSSVIPNLSAVFRLYDARFEDPMFPDRSWQLVRRTSGYRDALGTYFNLVEDLEPDHRRVLDLLGVKYLLATDVPSLPAPNFVPLPAEGDDPKVRTFVNQQAFPRAFFVRSVEIFKDPSLFLLEYPALDLRNTAVLEETPGPVSPAALPETIRDSDTVEILSYQPNRVVLRTATRSPRLLVLSDTYDDDWKALVDGMETKIYRADYALRAVVVPGGSHQVRFEYQPFLFWLGLGISGSCAVLLGVFWILSRTAHPNGGSPVTGSIQGGC